MSRLDRMLRCKSYHGPAVGGMPVVDDGTLSPMLTTERCKRCQKRYVVQYNLGSWQCWGHPGFYQGRAGTNHSFPASPHGAGTWSCCGQTANPHSPGFDRGGCTPQDHSAIGLEYVKGIPGSVIKVTFLELISIPHNYQNPKAYVDKIADGVLVIRYDYDTARTRKKRGFSVEEIHDPLVQSWRDIREEVTGDKAIGEARRYFGGPSQRLYALKEQRCTVLPYHSGLKPLPRLTSGSYNRKKKFPTIW